MRDAADNFRYFMSLYKALVAFTLTDKKISETLSEQEAAKLKLYEETKKCLKQFRISFEIVLEFRAGALHVTSPDRIRIARDMVGTKSKAFLHLAFNGNFCHLTTMTNDESANLCERIESVRNMHPAALSSDSLWAVIGKNLSSDDWAQVIIRIKEVNKINRTALSSGSFWAVIGKNLSSDDWAQVNNKNQRGE